MGEILIMGEFEKGTERDMSSDGLAGIGEWGSSAVSFAPPGRGSLSPDCKASSARASRVQRIRKCSKVSCAVMNGCLRQIRSLRKWNTLLDGISNKFPF